MQAEHIEAVFENGVFRPLQPIPLPEHQRVTLVMPAAAEALDAEVGYEPLPLEQMKIIRVRLKRSDDFWPLAYPVESVDVEQE